MSLKKGPHLQNLTDFSVLSNPLTGQNPLSWPETFCQRSLKLQRSSNVLNDLEFKFKFKYL